MRKTKIWQGWGPCDQLPEPAKAGNGFWALRAKGVPYIPGLGFRGRVSAGGSISSGFLLWGLYNMPCSISCRGVHGFKIVGKPRRRASKLYTFSKESS